MAGTVTVRVEGLRELDRALGELPKATGKNVLRRVLKTRAEPVAEAMRAGVPRVEEHLARSIAVSTKLSKRQRSLHRKQFRDDKASAEMFVGAGPDPAAHLSEYGSVHNQPVGWGRSAWDAEQSNVLDGIKDDLWVEIKKSADRLARKAARQARG